MKLLSRLLKVSVLFLLSFAVEAQEWQQVKSLPLKKNVTAYAVDIKGDFYLGFNDGGLNKYDSNGNFLESFSLSNTSSITLIDVQNNLKPFLFYYDIQQITILDRFSSVPKNYSLSDYSLEIAMMACPAPNGDFWVIENNPQRLKRVDPLRKAMILELQILLGDSIHRMQAYQNILVIGNESGILVFDQFGGLMKKLPLDGSNSFQIANGLLYAFTNSEIHEIDLFKAEVISTIKKPANAGLMFKSKDAFLSIEKRGIIFYKQIDP